MVCKIDHCESNSVVTELEGNSTGRIALKAAFCQVVGAVYCGTIDPNPWGAVDPESCKSVVYEEYTVSYSSVEVELDPVSCCALGDVQDSVSCYAERTNMTQRLRIKLNNTHYLALRLAKNIAVRLTQSLENLLKLSFGTEWYPVSDDAIKIEQDKVSSDVVEDAQGTVSGKVVETKIDPVSWLAVEDEQDSVTSDGFEVE